MHDALMTYARLATEVGSFTDGEKIRKAAEGTVTKGTVQLQIFIRNLNSLFFAY